MPRPPETYGDNFPVSEGWPWDPRTPWRHAHMTPQVPPRWVRRLGWWTLVALLMGLLMLAAAHEGFSAPAPASGHDLLVRFHEGVVGYPEGAPRALLHEVEFRADSLRRLNARYGLVAVERVVNPAESTGSLFRLRFCSVAGLDRTLAAYRRDSHVVSADLAGRQETRATTRDPPLVVPTGDA